MSQIKMRPPVGVLKGTGKGGYEFYVDSDTGRAMVDPDSVATLIAAGWTVDLDGETAITEFVANAAALPATGEALKVYVALDTGVMYRWTGSAYLAFTFGAGTDANGNKVLLGGAGEEYPIGAGEYGYTVGLWGDSVLDLDKPTLQGAVIATNPAKGIFHHLNKRLNQSLAIVAFGTTGGARSDELIDTELAAIVAARPRIVVLNAGANDIGQLYGGTAATCYANLIANYTTAIAACESIGATVVLMSPVLSYSYDSAAKVEVWNRIKQWMENVANLRPNTYYTDVSMVYADRAVSTPRMVGGTTTTGNNVYSPDAIHPTSRGSSAIALKLFTDVFDKLIATRIDPFLTWYNSGVGNSGKLITNPFSTGTGGTNNTPTIITGDIAATLYARAQSTGVGAVVTASKVARTDAGVAQPTGLGEWQQFRVQNAASVTKGASLCRFGANSYVSSAGLSDITVGVTPVQLLVEYQMDAAPVGYRGLQCHLITSGTPNTVYGGWGYLNAGADYDGDAYAGSTMDGSSSGIMATYPFVLPASAGAIGWFADAFIDAAVSDFTIRFGRSVIRPWTLGKGYCGYNGSTLDLY